MRCCKLGSCIDASAGPFFREGSQLGLDQGDIGLGVEVVLAEGSMRRTCCPSAAEKCGWGATHSPWNAISVWCPMTSGRSEEHTSELQSLMSISYAVFCLKKKKDSSYCL